MLERSTRWAFDDKLPGRRLHAGHLPRYARTGTQKPICISLPVNLRNYYPSETARNFFNSVCIAHTLTPEDTLETVAPVFNAKLKEVLKPENIRAQMDAYEKLEHIPGIRPVPLVIKNAAVKFFTELEDRHVSAVVSNMGRVSIPEGMKPYIHDLQRFPAVRRCSLWSAPTGTTLCWALLLPCAAPPFCSAFTGSLPRMAGCYPVRYGGGKMNTCPHCHIRVGGDTAYCPLCQNRLSGPAGEPYFPATAPRIHRASLLYKIVAFVLSALIVVAGAFDFLLMEDTPHRHFSILMAVWAVAVLRVLRAVLRRRFNGPRQIFNLLLLVSALLVFTDWFNGYTGYSLDLVVPILCCVALVCNFIFAFLRSRFTANALVYLLMNIGIGVLPYILLFFRIDYSGRLDATVCRGSSA